MNVTRVSDDREIPSGGKRVPSFYSGLLCDSTSDYLAGYVAMLVAMLFGGIHCVAWSFQFPSHTERLLWRISSLVVTAAPVVEFVTTMSVQPTVNTALQDMAYWLFNRISLLTCIPYVLARFMLLVLPFVALRSLPPEAYRTVVWPNVIVHAT